MELRTPIQGAKLLAASTAIALFASTAFAQSPRMTHYDDVEAGVWYEESAAALLETGALDDNEQNLRPHDMATRAEVAKMLVMVNDEPLIYPANPSFDDVPNWSWYFPYMESAANAGWVRGDSNCYERSRPCMARPRDGVNRAEMATLMVRAFNLTLENRAPTFPDNRRGMWYFNAIQSAADHCILQGDDTTGNVRPGDFMNRAEMVVMFHRASQNLDYGQDCGPGTPGPNISASAQSSTRVRVTFSANIDRASADDAFRYTVERQSGGGTVSINRAVIVDDRTVDLELGGSLVTGSTYRVTADDIRATSGVTFTDSATFMLSASTPQINSATLMSANTVRLRFSTDIRSAEADDAFRYTVVRTSGTGSISVRTARYIDARTVDLELAASPASQVQYLVTANDLRTSAGLEFTSTATFQMTEPIGQLTSIEAISPTRLRLGFNTSIDEARSEEIGRYRVSQDGRLLSLGRADYINNTTVELSLDETLQTQRPYVVEVRDLMTSGGVVFSDSGSFIYSSGTNVNFNATLTGLQEVPPVTTSASGTGTFVLSSSGLQYDITLKNLSGSAVTGAHFHRGGVGVSGPILHGISFSSSGRSTGTWTLSEQDRNDLLNGNVYVNVHTAAYPNGEIRGRLLQ